jgi:hypothetical protein
MFVLRALWKSPVRLTRHLGNRCRKLAVEALEGRALPSAYTFTGLTEAVPANAPGFPAALDGVAINNYGDVAFGAYGFRGAPGSGYYVATGGQITTIAQDGSAGLEQVGDQMHGLLSINSSGRVAFRAEDSITSAAGIFTGDGTAPPTMLLADGTVSNYYNLFPVINDSGAVAFASAQVTGVPGGVPEIFLYDGLAHNLTPPASLPYRSFPYPNLAAVGINNNGQVAFIGADQPDQLGVQNGVVYVTDGSTLTAIGGGSGQTVPYFYSVAPNYVSRPTINDTGTVAFTADMYDIQHVFMGHGLFAGNGGPLALIASETSNTTYIDYPTINNNGDVAYEVNSASNGNLFLSLYHGLSQSTDELIRSGDVLEGRIFVAAPYPIAVNDAGQVAFVAQLLDPATQKTYYELFRADPVPPSLSIGNATVIEGNSGTTNANFTVTLSEASSKTVTVSYTTADGTATTADNDYSSSSGTLTFAPGDTAKTITVLVNGDTKYEPDETFSVNLSAATNATIASGTGTGTIQNDDLIPSISLNSVSANEGDSGTTPFVFTVSLSNPSYQAITVGFASADGTATASDNDYTPSSGTLTFAPGETSKTISVLVNGDTKYESDETFAVNLSSPANATIAVGAGTGTIQNDDPIPSLSMNSVSMNEGNAGTTPFVFTVSLSNPSYQTITVDFTTGGGTATAGSDYQALSSTLTFNPGETAKPITVLVNGDTTDEPDETFNVVLSNATNATIATGTGTGTILNDDLPPSLTISDVTLPEGNSGTTSFVFTVSLSQASGKSVTVNYTTADGTATAGSDYIANSGTLSFAPGDLSKTITVLVNGDTTVEPDETFFVNLRGATNATIAVGTGTGTILNDDSSAAVSLSINSVSQFEGNSGTTPFVFTVSLSAPATSTVTVSYATADGTAKAHGKNPDYSATSGTLTFAPGDTAKTITVLVNGDTLVEPDEMFFVNLSNGTNATIAAGTGTGTILNDDILPTLSIGDVAQYEGNSGTTPFGFTVSLSAPSTSAITVKYATADGTAMSHGKDADYSAVKGTLTFNPGETVKTITVLVNGDTIVEPDETFFVNLSAATGAAIADGQGVGTILNDDGLALRLAAETATTPRNDLRPLRHAAVAPIVDEALARWQAAGVDPSKLSALRAVKIEIANLPGRDLGHAYPDRIVIDRDAAGLGWFVDRTPGDDSEFASIRHTTRARRRVDLLSVVMHELGHELGYDHRSTGLMAATLAPGVRVTPSGRLTAKVG